jgi:cyclic pyranopterin phosphate synthase
MPGRLLRKYGPTGRYFADGKKMETLRDGYDRLIDYMRISVTDRCNLRCVYCMPAEGVRAIPWKHFLTYEEIVRIVAVAARLGVKKIRLTGGEPLVRRDLSALVKSLNAIRGIEEISLTTNGLLLGRQATALARAGLKRVNVSLDSLRSDRYREITRGGDLRHILEGIHEAERAGLTPVKINMIAIRGINADELEDFARLTRYTPYQVRFIEFMPITPEKRWAEGSYVPSHEIRQRISAIGSITPVRMRKCGPARYYRFDGAPGVIGFISAVSHHFCGECNRVRLTCDGKLRLCLFSNQTVDLKTPMRSGASDADLEALMRAAIESKPRRHAMGRTASFEGLGHMSSIGG